MNSPQSAEQLLLAVLIQLSVILAVARAAGWVARRIGQPQVCGEIAAGLILGPSAFGKLFPEAFHKIFDPTVNPVFSMLSQVGLVFLLFLIGLEFDFGHVRHLGKRALSLSTAGIVFPFTLGLLAGTVIYKAVGANIDEWGFLLFFATAISITALPILGRILIEFNLNRTPLGVLAITAAAADDAAGWVILATVTAIVQSKFQPLRSVLMVGEVVGYALIMVLLVRPILLRWLKAQTAGNATEITPTCLAVVLVVVILSAIVTNLIGIFSIFGGFMVGAVLSDQHPFRAAISRRMKDFTTVFFLPIFFTYTGLRTDIGSMQGARMWWLLGLVLLAAMAGKFGGCTLASRLSGFSWRDGCTLGVLMNTRALMELVVVNIGLDLGLIPRSVFFMLVVMALVTTFMTAPLLKRLIFSTELEVSFLESDFMRERLRPALQRAS